MKIKSLLKSVLAIVLVGFMLVFYSGCNKLEEMTQSGSKLIIDLISAIELYGTQEVTVILADVVTSSGVVENRNAILTLRAVTLDPDRASTFYHDIVIQQIDIEYSRADGLNVEGVDVPYTFSQKATATIPANVEQPTTFDFVLLTHLAKMEPPLVDLVNLGQEHVLKLEAKITIHAKDGAGKWVEPAVGYVSIFCANFSDEQ